MKEEFKNINNKDKNQNVYISYNPESKIDNTKPVYKLSNAEQKEFSKLFNNTINEICLFADKHNFYRNNMLAYLISELLTHYLAYGLSTYDVFYPKQENDKPLGKWIDDGDYITIAHGHLDVKTCSVCGEKISIYDFDNYCPNCGTRME